MTDDRWQDAGSTELVTLTADECRRLLDRGGVGRIALHGKAAPTIRPVNFALWGDAIVVRTGQGRIIESARRCEWAAFEIDGIDALEHTGWSVVVSGKLRVIADDPSLLDLPLRAWASGQKDRFVALTLDELSGLRIPAGRGNR